MAVFVEVGRHPAKPARALLGLAFCLCGLSASPALARMNRSPYPTAEESLRLPRWCQVVGATQDAFLRRDTSSVSPELLAERARWAKVIGEKVMIYMHHYCAGLNDIGRYFDIAAETYEGVENDRQATLNKSLREFNFVHGYLAEAKSVLLPELLFNEAIAHRELGNFAKSVEKFGQALVVKPDYVAAYLELARTLDRGGDAAEAKRVLELGHKMTNGAPEIAAELRRGK